MKIYFMAVLSIVMLNGCAILGRRAIILHPIEKSDIFSVPAGTKIGDTITEKDGWFLSDYYVEEIVDAKVK